MRVLGNRNVPKSEGNMKKEKKIMEITKRFPKGSDITKGPIPLGSYQS